jgi:hydrogenase maturation protease
VNPGKSLPDRRRSGGPTVLPGVLVVGLGNPLMGDDGAGPAVIAEIRRRSRPRGAHRLEDGGTDILNLPGLWDDEPSLWVVDAVQGGRPAGTIHRLDHSELLGLPQRTASCHDLSLPECLRWISLAFPRMAGIRYRLWGIEPARVDDREGLSAAVASAVRVVADEVLSELSRQL